MMRGKNALLNAGRTLLISALPLAGVVVGFYRSTGFSSSAHTSPTGEISVVTAVAPLYPPLILRGSQISDKEPATVSVRIDEQGNVTSAQAVGGGTFFRRPAEKAARQWRFVPSESGEKVRTAKIIFVFRIMPPNTPPEELGTVFTPPNLVEIRSEYFKVPGRGN
ncbi:MAG TPA: energy transducer TonB [Pyrinomonadaceae bacterium]|jgi:hypothetical protein